MTFTIIIVICTLLLLAYIFDLSAAKTRIPPVILLLLSGWLVRLATDFVHIEIPDLTPMLPILGTLGLVLIVLEGSLELELNPSKLPIIKKSLVGSILPLLALAFVLAWVFYYFGNFNFKDSLVNALPFCIISSAVAISSVKNLSSTNKEFIIYESSLSDIFGVLIFNFLVLNETLNLESFGHFGLQILIIAAISFVATIALSFLLGKIEHHIKFAPIIILIILIFAISEIYHLPALIFIMIFGLFIGNLDELKRFKIIERFKPDQLNVEVLKFKELTAEATFLIRSLFFLLFGYSIQTEEILDLNSLGWASAILGLVMLFRIIQLKLSKLALMPLLFIAPRGLITILLFLSIPASQKIAVITKSMVLQLILLSAFVMMVGLIISKRKKEVIKTNSTDEKFDIPVIEPNQSEVPEEEI